jgi:hypothetical protein
MSQPDRVADESGASADVTGGMPVTDAAAPPAGADARISDDPLARLDPGARGVLSAIADHLIPAAHGMPSAGDVLVDDRLRFVLRARPDLVEPLVAALRPELGEDPQARLATLGSDEPNNLAALQLVIVGGYYTDRTVRQLIGYPGQMAIEVRSWELPPYIEEGLIDGVLSRGQRWRDPNTGQRAVVDAAPRTYAERYGSPDGRAEGGHDGGDGS